MRPSLLALLLPGLLVSCGGGSNADGPAAPAAPVTVLAVADIASCGGKPAADSAAARTAALIERQGPGLPLLLPGDLAYNAGTAAEFHDCYDPTYGRFLSRSHPAPGNHDYGVPDAAEYFRYFGARAGTAGQGWYSVDIGSWHVIALNSNVSMQAGSPQETWLRADLAANANRRCVLAFWHHPRFSSSTAHGDDPRSNAAWRALEDAGADVILAGHDHTYERFAPQNADGQPDATGPRQFVVGTGGAALYAFGPPRPNSEARIAGHFGVLKLTLGDGRYAWEFLPVAAGGPSDRGEADCVR